MSEKIVKVSDKMQKNYRYILSAPIGRDFDKSFKPELSPKEMLALGVFGGRYMRDCSREFPKDWFKKAKFFKQGLPGHDPNINYFKVDASQPLLVWIKKGWINQEHDPRGWFQWYCRYYMGRRMKEEDKKQIKRWMMMVRHIGQIKKNCKKKDLKCRIRQRQALLHWAYDSRNL
ncbi:MAG TPA: hypothetical protein PLA41_02710 [Candidatus Pacearchaeota archaeon]|nr:hypothetical protein [Candidatus Parcubacteria bacterium]HNZ83970.1 hypothetical protein [Candidatus Pacearchaeota archaeon]HOU46035.1 hypothetical protein [Candidatus Pacearchaeota archaeon]HPM08474.1 hypothetical protein [Candidatus Pacearchaeota archaeon]HQI74854.1 hypothetical protein [Candidatus Pacearchaeota archaeon]